MPWLDLGSSAKLETVGIIQESSFLINPQMKEENHVNSACAHF